MDRDTRGSPRSPAGLGGAPGGGPPKRSWAGRIYAISAVVVGFGWLEYVWHLEGIDLRRAGYVIGGPCVFGPIFLIWGIVLLTRGKLRGGQASVAAAGLLPATLAAIGVAALMVYVVVMIVTGKWHLMP